MSTQVKEHEMCCTSCRREIGETTTDEGMILSKMGTCCTDLPRLWVRDANGLYGPRPDGRSPVRNDICRCGSTEFTGNRVLSVWRDEDLDEDEGEGGPLYVESDGNIEITCAACGRRYDGDWVWV